MPFIRPTLPRLIARASSDIQTRLSGASALVRRSVEAVCARVVAGAAHGVHGHLVWLSKQLFPDTAEAEFAVRWASIWGLTPTAAVKADGPVTITGTNGKPCPAATLWRSADGVEYTQDADATISGGSATINVTAKVAGAAGNQIVGVQLSLVVPVDGINTAGTVSGSGIEGGIDVETTAARTARLLLRLQTPPKGGGPGDYVNWALEVSGVTRAWEYANIDGPGTVGVRFVMDGKVGTIIPTAGEVAIVQAHINTLRPVTANVTVYAPTAAATAFTLAVVPNTEAVKATVLAELTELYLRVAEPGATILLSQINEAISIAAGEIDHTLTTPAADVTHTANQMPILGTITWV